MNDVKKLPIKNRASLETGLYFIVRGVDGVLDSVLRWQSLRERNVWLSEQDPTNQPRSHGFSEKPWARGCRPVVEWSMS